MGRAQNRKQPLLSQSLALKSDEKRLLPVFQLGKIDLYVVILFEEHTPNPYLHMHPSSGRQERRLSRETMRSWDLEPCP